MITQQQLKQQIEYCPITGNTISKNTGNPIGYISKQSGYKFIKINGRAYQVHRLAFLYMTGELPPQVVDHINGSRHDNRFANLRLATYSQNNMNRTTQPNNKLGVRGVCFRADNKTNPYQVHGTINKSRIHLGFYSTIEEAATRRLIWEQDNFGEFQPGAPTL